MRKKRICNWLYRGIAFCGPPTVRTRWSVSKLCRLRIGDTAERGEATTKIGRARLPPSRDFSLRFKRKEKGALAIQDHWLALGWLCFLVSRKFIQGSAGASPYRLEEKSPPIATISDDTDRLQICATLSARSTYQPRNFPTAAST